MKRLVELFQEYLEYLRDLSEQNSDYRRQLATERLKAHREYMEHRRRYNPYIHPEEWDRENI